MKNMIITIAACIFFLAEIAYSGSFFETLVIKNRCSYVARECAISAGISGYESVTDKGKIEELIKRNGFDSCDYKVKENTAGDYREIKVEVRYKDIKGSGTYYVNDKASKPDEKDEG